MASASVFVVLFLQLVAAFLAAEGRLDKYEEASHAVKSFLQEYNLPWGLLPTSLVTSFHCDSRNATFVMKIDHPCYMSIEEEVLWFDDTIKGKVAASRIEDVSGIQARMFLVWFPVMSIHVDDAATGFVYIEVGPSYRKLLASGFKSPRQCTREEAPVNVGLLLQQNL